MNELFNVNQRLHNFLTKQQKAGGNTTDENRPIGTQATLNNNDVYWSGQNYGWQSQDSYNKLKEGPEFRAGHIASTRFGTDVNQAIDMGVDALPEQVKSTALDVVRQGVQLYQGLPQGIRTGINNVGQGLADVNELVSKTTNISPIITGEALTAAATAGVGNVVKKATTGMNVVDNLRNTVALAAKPGFDYNLTVSPKFRAPGVKEGIGQSDLFKDGVQKLRGLEQEGIVKRKKYADQLNTGLISQEQYKKRLAKLKKTEDANYSTLGTVEDPDIFEVKSQINRDPIDPNLPAHQHHAAGKAMTTPWVRKALQLGDDDDVVGLFEFHKLLTGSGMGNAKSGIIDMPGFSHIARDARTPADVPMSVHSFMKKSGADIEILTTRVEKILGDPKNMDELLEKYSTFAAEYLIPQKELSLKRLTQVLTEHRNTLSPKQAKVFDTLVSKLNKANT